MEPACGPGYAQAFQVRCADMLAAGVGLQAYRAAARSPLSPDVQEAPVGGLPEVARPLVAASQAQPRGIPGPWGFPQAARRPGSGRSSTCLSSHPDLRNPRVRPRSAELRVLRVACSGPSPATRTLPEQGPARLLDSRRRTAEFHGTRPALLRAPMLREPLDLVALQSSTCKPDKAQIERRGRQRIICTPTSLWPGKSAQVSEREVHAKQERRRRAEVREAARFTVVYRFTASV